MRVKRRHEDDESQSDDDFNASNGDEQDEAEDLIGVKHENNRNAPDTVPSEPLAVASTATTATAATTRPPPRPPKRSTAVDGQGMWRSWTRVFAKPESAMLDLLDNCFDAALKPGFEGRVVMECTRNNVGVSIMNNSRSPIKPLEAALTVYKSSKNSNSKVLVDGNNNINNDDKEAIGENGVGLKQGCATLSDCSIVLTRNLKTVEFGIIAKGLQSSQGVYLPSFAFNIREIIPSTAEMGDRVRKWLSKNPDIFKVLGHAFGPSVDVIDEVTQFATSLWKGPWQHDDHVFLLILCNLKKNCDVHIPPPHELIDSVIPAKVFIRDIKAMLPEYYINLPSEGMFDFTIDKERIDFSFWQHRLVELTKFEVNIPTEQPFPSLPKEDWDQPGDGTYKMNIYCGFDAQRVDQNMRLKEGTSTCNLYIYSCQAGRLIKKEMDARHMLGLPAGGVDFTQGLTVIINDVAGKLPLTPTKDSIAWSEQKNGAIHQNNLIAWTGAVTHFFWNHHKNKFASKGKGQKVKEILKNTIRSFALEDKTDIVTFTGGIDDAQFNHFDGIRWKRVEPNYDNRWKIRKVIPQNNDPTKGPDTLFTITSDRVKQIRQGKPAVKRKSNGISNGNANASDNTDTNTDAGSSSKKRRISKSEEPEESLAWTGVGQNAIPRVTMGVLSYLRTKDKGELFDRPVVEQLPEIEERYLKEVSEPMDFRTIEEERVHSYTSITQLREDLILVFENCITYNGAESKFGKIAMTMVDSLDDAFESTDVKQLSMSVLSYFREADEREIFELPVLEQVPELEKAYLEVVTTPMDFTTIEEERLASYTSLSDLREDLTLVFRNCIAFNGPNSVYGHVAQQLLDVIDETIEDTVAGKRRKKKKVHYDEIINPFDEDTDEGDNVEDEEKPSKPPPKKKKIPYNTLEKELRKAKEQLKTERTRIRELEKQLRAHKKA